MKKIIMCLILSWMSLFVCGQENFEGVITYQNINVNTTTKIGKVVAYFKEDFIKVFSYTEEKDGISDKTIKEKEILIDLKNGFAYNFLVTTNLVIKDSITNDNLFKEGRIFVNDINSKVKVLGQECIISKLDSTSDKITDVAFLQNLEFLYAKNMFFKVPNQYKFYEGLTFLSNGINLGLGMKFKVPMKDGLINISLIATNIDKKKINDSVFIIPTSAKIFDSEKKENELLQEFNIEDDKLKQSLERLKIEQLKSDSLPPLPPINKPTKSIKKKVNTKNKK